MQPHSFTFLIQNSNCVKRLWSAKTVTCSQTVWRPKRCFTFFRRHIEVYPRPCRDVFMTLLSRRYMVGLHCQCQELLCFLIDNIVYQNVFDVFQACAIQDSIVCMCAVLEAPSAVGVKRYMQTHVDSLTQCQISFSALAGLLGLAV